VEKKGLIRHTYDERIEEYMIKASESQLNKIYKKFKTDFNLLKIYAILTNKQNGLRFLLELTVPEVV